MVPRPPRRRGEAKVRVGDPVTLVQEFSELGECVTGKCLDNRVAAFVAVEALCKAKDVKYEVILAATVQEEIGLVGALSLASGNRRPSVNTCRNIMPT